MDCLKALDFSIIIRFLSGGHFPNYLGSVLRGAFGSTFKRCVCVTGKSTCQNCILSGSCVYSYIFETPTPQDSKRMRLYPFVPHPFVLEPPFITNGLVHENETIQFKLILIGRGMEFFPYFLYTFIEVGKVGLGKQRVPFIVQEVLAHDGRRIYQEGDDAIQPLPEPMRIPISEESDYNGHSLTIEFETPLRMTYKNKQAEEFAFPPFVGTVLRRLSSLAYFHHGFELSLDFRGLLDKAQKIEVYKENSYYQPFKRYSARQKREMDLGGIMGRFTLSGDLSPFMPILRAGEILHVGKGTSFGLGKYRLIELR